MTSPWADRDVLTGSQYRTDSNLEARRSIYAFGRPRVDLPAAVLDLAGLTGAETVADIGCGNGAYLAELSRRGHSGSVVGIDMSAGMLAAARGAVPGVTVLRGDAARLPLGDACADVTLAPHMLYHVPDPMTAIAELRRVTRAGGRVLVVLNGADHLRELRDLAAAQIGLARTEDWAERLRLDDGEAMLRAVFGTVERRDLTGELALADSAPVQAYLRSMVPVQELPDPDGAAVAAARAIPFAPDGVFRVRTHTGCLIGS